MAVLNESLAIRAADLYSTGLTFDKVGEKLSVSKGRVGDLIREGIQEAKNQDEGPDGHPGVQVETEQVNEAKTAEVQVDYPHNPRPESYTLETQGIPRRIVLTPKALMIFNIWTNSGFDGDLSDFLEDAVIYLYETKQPANRGNFR